MQEEIKIRSLSNGLRHIQSEGNSKNIGYVAVIIKAGSRYEPEDRNGLAHFMEHCLFKGTKKRKSHHIINRMEIVGGEIDAYTTKEFTCIYSVFMNQHIERALELLADIVFNSQFPKKEIEKEKNVVIDEIQSYLDNPSEQIFEDFEMQVFSEHPLGRPILGSIESVKSIEQKDLNRFKDQYYSPTNMVLSTSCSIPERKMNRLVEKYFAGFDSAKNSLTQSTKLNYKATQKKEIKNTYQTHYMSGGPAYNAHDDRSTTMLMLNNLLGGPAMNSRLNLNIREKHGYTYYIESGYNAYADEGLFYIYLGSDKKNIPKIERLIKKELNDLKSKKLTTTQFKNALQQFKGQVSIASESTVRKVLNRGKDLLIFDRIKNLDEVLKEIDQITALKMQEVANEVLDDAQFSRLIFEND